ncbi:MAG: hypothetical protein ABIH23_29750 [bacterium]
MSPKVTRRTFIQTSLMTSASGALAMGSNAANTPAQRTQKTDTGSKPSTPTMMGKIGDLEVSRLLIGGNLLTYGTHSRDLKYVSALVKHYNTQEKILETMALAESHGVNTIVTHAPPAVTNLLRKYRYELGGEMQWIFNANTPFRDNLDEYRKQVEELVEMGGEAVYIWGEQTDRLVEAGRMDLLAKAVGIIKELGVPSGVGAHALKSIKECEKNGIETDFYVKTFHHHNYPTAPRPDEITGPHAEVPGYWCANPEEVAEFMMNVEKPWIAFKVMAAGAIPPADAFQYAFDQGADHLLAGMFDFQVVEDVRIASEAVSNANRTRAWMS